MKTMIKPRITLTSKSTKQMPKVNIKDANLLLLSSQPINRIKPSSSTARIIKDVMKTNK